MPFRPPQSSLFRFIGAGAVLSLILLAFLTYGHLEGYGFSSGYVIKDQASPNLLSPEQCVEAQVNSTGEWEFDARRDADNHGLSEGQCLSAFPKLFADVDRSAEARAKGEKGIITFKEVDEAGKIEENGMVRAVIKGGEVSLWHPDSMTCFVKFKLWVRNC